MKGQEDVDLSCLWSSRGKEKEGILDSVSVHVSRVYKIKGSRDVTGSNRSCSNGGVFRVDRVHIESVLFNKVGTQDFRVKGISRGCPKYRRHYLFLRTQELRIKLGFPTSRFSFSDTHQIYFVQLSSFFFLGK